jgi:hypothetical protein
MWSTPLLILPIEIVSMAKYQLRHYIGIGMTVALLWDDAPALILAASTASRCVTAPPFALKALTLREDTRRATSTATSTVPRPRRNSAVRTCAMLSMNVISVMTKEITTKAV